MPRGDKSAYTDKQKRKAEHIEESYEARGVPEGEAERRAWASVNKDEGGGKKSGSGRGHPSSNAACPQGWQGRRPGLGLPFRRGAFRQCQERPRRPARRMRAKSPR
jgi:plasmid stabilization system protein ParE